ncbi:hypothetical protein ACF1BP_22505 [Streptomyces sp. NPDC014735]|uniref:hypothetical protein n=1 Tax=Streptomyces sp. NPDC014735 TaxID=3364887 RepID=UPI0036F7141A
MTLKDLGLALAGPDPTGLAHMLRKQWFHSETPQRLLVDHHPVEPSEEWLDRYAHASRSVAAFFGPGRSLVLHQGELAKATFDFDGGPEQLAETLRRYPFDIASFRSRHREWKMKEIYSAPGFGGSHYPHGWACAFRGDGHQRLVSRRWLESGPWRLHRAPDDTTLAQFHDLGLDASAALEQARPAHRRMGHSDEGGFLHEPYRFRNELKGFYDAGRRVLKIVILGRTVSSVEMRDACAIRGDSRSTTETPLDNIAFVFIDPDAAHTHLPRLWPYGLECWTIIHGHETRLDTDTPPEAAGDHA